MLNNIIVDKLRIAVPSADIVKEIAIKNKKNMTDEEIRQELISLKERLVNALKKHLPRKAFVIMKRYSYFIIEFNPTRYNRQFGAGHDDVNLQMIPEEIFLKVFKAIEAVEPIIVQKAHVVELNLTKNVLLSEEVHNYIDMLLNIRPAHGLHPVSFGSKDSKSVYFTSLKRDLKEKDYVGTRLLKFYNKTYELQFVKGKDVSKLKLRESLTDEEKQQLGSRYSEINNTVDLDGANLLRVEATYLHSRQLSKAARFIGGEGDTKLTVLSITGLLAQNRLYNHFDKFFEAEFKEFIFCNDINTALSESGKKYTQILPTLSLGENLGLESEMYFFMNLLETAGMCKSTIDKKLVTINSGIVNNMFYKELYDALFLNQATIPNKINFELYKQLEKITDANIQAGNTMPYDELEALWDEDIDDYNAVV